MMEKTKVLATVAGTHGLMRWIGVVALLFAVASYSQRSTPDLVTNGALESHTHEALTKIGELRSSLNEQQGGLRGFVSTDKAAMDAIRASLSEMERVEDWLLKDRAARSQAVTDRTFSLLPVATVLSLSFLGLGMFRINRVMVNRQRGAATLQRSGSRLRLALEGADIGDWQLDPVTHSIRCSLKHDQIFGYPERLAEWNYGKLLEHVHLDDRDRVAEALQQSMAKGGDWACECRIIRRDGSPGWIWLRGTAIMDDEGCLAEMLGMVRDITKRKLTEEALLSNEARLQMFIENAPTGFAIFNREMHYLAASHRWMEEHHFTASVIGRSHYEVFPDVPERWRVVHRCGLAGEIIRADADRLDRADGTSQWLKWEVRPWHGSTGEIGGIMIAAEDITERIQAQEEISKLHAELAKRAEAALELSDFSVQHASAATYWVAPDARLLRVNTAACEMLGYAEAELLSLAVTDLDPNFNAERWPSHWQELRELKRMRFETQQRHQAGHLIPVEVDLNWFEFEGQEFNFAFIRDVTVVKQAEAERQKFVSLAESSGDFIGMSDLQGTPFFINDAGLRLVGLVDLAHGLRSPVTEFFFPEDQAFIREEFLPRAQREGHAEVEIRFRHFQTGEAIQMIYNVFIVLDADGQPTAFATVSRDITERRRRELALAATHAALEVEITARRRLEVEILQIGERQQARIGQDLHDDLGQQLVGMSMLMQLLSSQMSVESHPLALDAARLGVCLGEAITTTRNLAKSLYPVELERGGLMLALEDLANRTQLLARIICTVSADTGLAFEKVAEIHLYRIVQESISNALKHGKARHITVECRARGGVFTLTVTNDGNSFEPGKGNGLGLHLLEYRARIIGGRLTVTRGIADGCQVRCSIGEPAEACR